MAHVLEHPLLGEVVDVTALLAIEQGIEPEAFEPDVVRKPEVVVGIYVTDLVLGRTVWGDVHDRALSGLAARRSENEVSERIDDVVRFHGSCVRGVVLQLCERLDKSLSVDDAKRFAFLVVEDVLALAAGVDAEWRTAETLDLLGRVVAGKRERVAEVRTADDAGLKRQLGGLGTDICRVLHLSLESARLRQRERHVEECSLSEPVRLHQLEIEPVRERHVQAELILGLDCRLEVPVAELRLGDLTAGQRVVLVLIEECRTKSGRSPRSAELELLDARNIDILADTIRAGNSVERVAAGFRSEQRRTVASDETVEQIPVTEIE